MNAQGKEARTQTQMLVRLYEEERCMGKPETCTRHKTTERARKGTRTQSQMLVRLYDEERCMGMPETLPHHKTTEHCREENRPQAQTVCSMREPALTRGHTLLLYSE